MAKFFDPSVAAVQVKPTTVSKVNTLMQMVLISSSLAAPALFDITAHPVLDYMQYAVAVSTCASGTSYLFAKDVLNLVKSATRS